MLQQSNDSAILWFFSTKHQQKLCLSLPKDGIFVSTLEDEFFAASNRS